MLQIRPHSLLLVAALLATSTAAWAQGAQGLDPALIQQVQHLAQAGASAGAPAGARVEVQVGALDARLKLAPCLQVQPYLPPGAQMWGRSRIGLRCLAGEKRWNVSLPVQVKVFSRALVSGGALPAGTLLTQEHLAEAEIDIAAEAGAVFTQPADLLGRILSRPLMAGETVRGTGLKQRQWFAAGETVMVRVIGPGYAIAGQGQAMTVGMEGREVKVRFDSGRVVTGRATGDRQVEVLL